MATRGASSGDFIRPLDGTSMDSCRQFRAVPSQVIRLGDVVVLGTTTNGNRIQKAGADPATDRKIAGIAAANILTPAAVPDYPKDAIPVWPATSTHRFRALLADTQALAADDLGTEVGIVEDVTRNIWRVDKTEVTAKVVRIVELLDQVGDVNAAVGIVFIAPETLA